MNVLVTGAAGFIGRHFVRHFVGRGIGPVGVDVAYDEGPSDCRDYFDSADERFDLVVHCAAVVGGRAGIDGQPAHLMAEDLSIDAALARWALRTRPGRIVYFSSSAAYPTWMQAPEYSPMPLAEDAIAPGVSGAPDQTYGWVKLTGERLAAELDAAGIATHVFRPFSGYGHDQAPDYPFPAFIRRAAQHEMPFDIWGDPRSARDWIHVDDIVGAVLAAIDQDVRGPVNLCTGRATTFERLAYMCMEAAGYHTPIRIVHNQPQGVHWRVGDPTRMRQFYTPKVPLEEGIERALRAIG